MNLHKKILSTSAAAALGLAGLIGAAAPAHAGVSDVILNGSCILTSTSLMLAPGDTIRITNSFSSSVNTTLVSATGAASIASASNEIFNPGGSSGSIALSDGSSCNQTLTFTIMGGGGGGGGGSSSSESAPPQTFELSLTPADGTTCTNSSESGTQGTWISLPGASDCTPPATKPGATLLGWATNPNFPIEIAQRQVDNGWGAYETFNDAGQLTGVFIPAGGATFLSAAGKLYAIWSE